MLSLDSNLIFLYRCFHRNKSKAKMYKLEKRLLENSAQVYTICKHKYN